MTVAQEFSSLWAPKPPPVAEVPHIGSKAPASSDLHLESGRPAVIAFLRHCGCPFAEKTFLDLREVARAHKEADFIAVSHSDETATNTWLNSLPQAGSEPENLRVIVDEKLEVYAQWGLGVSGFAHVLSSLWGAWRLAKDEGITNRPTESGSRWQMSGFFAVDSNGTVKWGRSAQRADDIPDFEEAVSAAEVESGNT